MKVTEEWYIHPPTAPDMTACLADGSDQAAKKTYAEQVELFRELQGLVATWRTDLEKWITDYFGPLLERVGSLMWWRIWRNISVILGFRLGMLWQKSRIGG
ncbi:hypothetical protein G7066_13990 [Leucobacter coleopterorum]|uniref:Uncharacterized protein n=1 Tax=Leucobacter coleopterorum TaxID=2714933 RepID=A0ABX6JYL3_9MICO|nr:hypothetical protein [Leucobacter coleopterorum]QIM19408.1 hypothetical protein G7066_13990 [Leucobacter coleopterorum]